MAFQKKASNNSGDKRESLKSLNRRSIAPERQEVDAASPGAESDQYPDQTNFYSYAKVPGDLRDNREEDKKKQRRKAAIWVFIVAFILFLALLAISMYMPEPAQP